MREERRGKAGKGGGKQLGDKCSLTAAAGLGLNHPDKPLQPGVEQPGRKQLRHRGGG